MKNEVASMLSLPTETAIEKGYEQEYFYLKNDVPGDKLLFICSLIRMVTNGNILARDNQGNIHTVSMENLNAIVYNACVFEQKNVVVEKEVVNEVVPEVYISKEEADKLLAENETLKQENNKLFNDYYDLKSDNKALKTELEKVKFEIVEHDYIKAEYELAYQYLQQKITFFRGNYTNVAVVREWMNNDSSLEYDIVEELGNTSFSFRSFLPDTPEKRCAYLASILSDELLSKSTYLAGLKQQWIIYTNQRTADFLKTMEVEEQVKNVMADSTLSEKEKVSKIYELKQREKKNSEDTAEVPYFETPF